MASYAFVSVQEAILAGLYLKPMTLREIRALPVILQARGVSVAGDWREAVELINTLVNSGIVRRDGDRLVLDKSRIPAEALGIIESTARVMLEKLKSS